MADRPGLRGSPRSWALKPAKIFTRPVDLAHRRSSSSIEPGFGAAAGLELVDQLTAEPALEGYHLLPSVRGDLLAKLGRREEARAEFERGASLTRNARERELLLERAAACARESPPPGPR